MIDLITSLLLLVGSGFMLLSAVGLMRMPDLFTRLQTTSKASTFGIGCILLAAVIYFARLGVASRSILIAAFIWLTTPIAAHMIGRAAYIAGRPLEELAAQDALRGRHAEADPPSEESIEGDA